MKGQTKDFILFARELESVLLQANKPLMVRDLKAMTFRTIQKFDRCLISRAVHWLNHTGIPVASGQKGYSYAWRAHDLDETMADLLRRQTGLEEKINDVRRNRQVMRERETAELSLFVDSGGAGEQYIRGMKDPDGYLAGESGVCDAM